MFDEQRDGQAPLHLELAIEPFARLLERILDEISGMISTVQPASLLSRSASSMTNE
jgi:hypothetical protein